MAIKKQAAGDDARLAALSSKALLRRAMQRDPDGESYWKIVFLLHKRADRATFEAAFALCRDERPRARQVSADVVARIGENKEAPRSWVQEAGALLEALEREEEPNALSSLVSALGCLRYTEAMASLERLKTHPDFFTRWSLTHTLAALDDPLATQTLIEMTRDEDEGIRDWATFGLSNMEADTPAIREALAARLDDADAQTRVEAMYGLAERGDMRVVEAVLRACEPNEDGKVLFDHVNDRPGYRLLPALGAMCKAEPGRSSEELRAAIRACASFKHRL